ncbi:hypothetical protein [Sporosarcina sp. FA9]|uniref:hypothetical protein n=1 Tax=Sporosarcina sp. FA9 TaxID=3413030 RepID=UPI003F658FFA
MQKGIVGKLSSIIVIFIALVGCNPISNSEVADKELKSNIIDTKIKGFESFEEIDNSTPIIIKGIKKEEKNIIMNYEYGDPDGYTESNFEITDVFKNSEQNKRIAINKNIPVLEHSFHTENEHYNYGGYMNMNNEDEYLLFLTENEGMFIIQGVLFGKVPFSSEETEIHQEISNVNYTSETIITAESFFKEARNKYKK